MATSTLLEPRLLARLTAKKERLDALRPLPRAALARLNEQLTVEWIYNSNAIEGSTLTLRETELILQHGLTIGGKSLREHFEVINHREAIGYVQEIAADKTPITPFHVRQIHRLVLTRIDEENAGQYRRTNVRIGGAAHQPPEAWQVPQAMDDWSRWLETEARALHPVERAALAHHQLTAIHPFVDGNGRTARLVMNLLLFREGYPPTVILRANRRQYYRVLAQADRGNSNPLVNFVGRAVERSLNLYLEAIIPRTRRRAVRDEWIPLKEAAAGTPYSQEYLSLLARLGRLDAIKIGRVWHTTPRALKAYRESLDR
jgi:Fic family protein